ncbi:MAG TPA: CvpA family protein [Candidatus Sulfomarinibacteraceae bacterium]|nr:CvpA family protein [Candidatus Sulfomarinibacteraceae bacterium]
MVSLQFVFWFMVIFFALIGYMRAWQREVIALTGLIASIAALITFGESITRLVGALTGAVQDPNDLFALRRQQFWIQAIFHSLVAFFSYQVVARIAEQATGGRLGERLRGDLEKRILGALIGAINGYLVIGGLWGFLEYQLTANGYVRLQPGEPYPFDPSVIVRPDITAAAASLTEYLPMGLFSPTVWLILFFASFFVVIVALI